MVAEATMMPDNPDEESQVREMLNADSALRAAVRRIGEYASELFPDASFNLNTRHHDEWDPPLSLIIRAPYSDPDEFSRRDREFISWLVEWPGYDPDRLFVMVLPHNMRRRVA